MTSFVVWPRGLLRPREARYDPVPLSRGSPGSLGGVGRWTRTDLGFWVATFGSVRVRSVAARRAWNAIRTELGGRAGLCVIPVYADDTAPYPLEGGVRVLPSAVSLPHSDGTPFSDGTGYPGNAITVQTVAAVAIGATVMQLAIMVGEADLAGVRFSFNHALYETGGAILEGGVWTVRVAPRVRAPIAAGEVLQFDRPTLLARLRSDTGMDITRQPRAQASRPTVEWEEAVDYWNDLAAAG